MLRKDDVEAWIANMALHISQNAQMDISHLLRCGPGRVLLNLVDQPISLSLKSFTDRVALRHIVDWLVSSKMRDEAWLSRVDEQGRPLKLNGLSRSHRDQRYLVEGSK